MKHLLIISSMIVIASCNNNVKSKEERQAGSYKTTGSIERNDAALDSLLDQDSKIEIIAEGFDWCEGPLWIEKQNMLIFSDVPANTIYKWTAGKGKEVYLSPSGYTEERKRGGETGSNGLLLDPNDNLVLCQHGNRQMARMDAAIDQPKPNFIPLARGYKGKRFNSPNDGDYNSLDELFFTDPPYRLEKQGDDDEKKELPYNGVYKIKTNYETRYMNQGIAINFVKAYPKQN